MADSSGLATTPLHAAVHAAKTLFDVNGRWLLALRLFIVIQAHAVRLDDLHVIRLGGRTEEFALDRFGRSTPVPDGGRDQIQLRDIAARPDPVDLGRAFAVHLNPIPAFDQ